MLDFVENVCRSGFLYNVHAFFLSCLLFVLQKVCFGFVITNSIKSFFSFVVFFPAPDTSHHSYVYCWLPCQHRQCLHTFWSICVAQSLHAMKLKYIACNAYTVKHAKEPNKPTKMEIKQKQRRRNRWSDEMNFHLAEKICAQTFDVTTEQRFQIKQWLNQTHTHAKWTAWANVYKTSQIKTNINSNVLHIWAV